MSRGLGYVQRRVLEELAKVKPSIFGRWISAGDLTRAVFGSYPWVSG